MGGLEDSDDDGAEDDDSVRKSPPKKLKHVSGDDLGDSLLSADDLAKKTCHIDDIIRSKFGAKMSDPKIKNSDDSEDDESDETKGNDDNNDDGSSDHGDSSDEEEEEEDGEDSDGNEGNSDMPRVKDWEQSEDDNLSTDDEEMKNSELENLKSLDSDGVKSQGSKYISPGKRDTDEKSSLIEKDSLPFIIEAPKNIRELCSLIDNRPEADIVEAINRIRVCNAIRLSTENRRKMQVFQLDIYGYYGNLGETFSPKTLFLIHVIAMILKLMVSQCCRSFMAFFCNILLF